mgnify:CR=1 FL=1
MMAEASGSIRELQLTVQRAWSSQVPDDCLRQWAELGLAERPAAVWFPRRIYPYAAQLDQVFDSAGDGEAEVILFADERRQASKHNLRDLAGRLQRPIIDLSGRAGPFADVHFDIDKPETWAETAKCILAFRRRRSELQEPFTHSVEPEIQLMAHAYVCGRPLKAMRYPQVSDTVCYPGFWSAEETVPAAEKLVRRGYMKKIFFDRLHECRKCASRRLSVREVCPSCTSSDLTQEELIHHYHCASLLPESVFRNGSALICPKCRQQLRNYGKDYDKPGRVMLCGSCGKTTSEPEVGFVCMDCSATCGGDEAKLVDVHGYELTDAAVAEMTRPAAASDLPRGRRAAEAETHPIAIAEITYFGKQDVVSRYGETTFDRLRRLFIENMTNFLAERGEYRAGQSSDYFVIYDYDEEFARLLDQVLAHSTTVLATSINPKVNLATQSARVGRERR